MNGIPRICRCPQQYRKKKKKSSLDPMGKAHPSHERKKKDHRGQPTTGKKIPGKRQGKKKGRAVGKLRRGKGGDKGNFESVCQWKTEKSA